MTSEHHGLGPTRARVLALLQSAVEPLSVADVADGLGLHKNSARFHLEGLRDAGYADCTTGVTGHLGRPPLLFTATSDSPNVTNSHLMELAQVLIRSFVATLPDAYRLAEEAGLRWGREVSPGEAAPDDVLAGLVAQLAARGFGTLNSGDALTFTRCPFRPEVGLAELPIVCAVHQGFVDGYLQSSGGGLAAARIQVGPRLCHLALLGAEEPEPAAVDVAREYATAHQSGSGVSP